MIYEHYTNGGWIGFDTHYVKSLRRKVPRLCVGIKKDGDQIKTTCVCLIHKNTEILSDLYKAVGHYLGESVKG